MYRFWNTIIEPIFERLQPEVIVEVGSDKGDNTRNLLKFCERNGSRLHVIDPLPKYDVSEWRQGYGEKLVFHRGLSLDVLPEIDRFDTVLVDGDHNWYTVFHELELIEKLSGDRGFPLVMLHDVGWPYGRRDLYYDPETIPEDYRNPYSRKGLSPESSGLLENGGLNAHLGNAVREGGARNGVLTAVEDFLKRTERDFELKQVPGLYGLGILIPLRIKEQNGDLAGFLDTLDSLASPRSAEQIEQVERSRLQTEIGLQERQRRVKYLQDELHEASQKAARESRLNAELCRKLSQERQNVRRLTRWIGKLDAGFTAVLGSRRWKIGNFLGNLSERKLPGRREPAGVGSTREVLGRFRTWKRRRASGCGAQEGSSCEGSSRERLPSEPVSGRIGPESEGGIKRVQVGCGPHNIMEDWWNVDIRGFPGVDAVMDATKPWPYEDLEYVYGEHFLEHLTLDGAIAFLSHAGNSLRGGGILRLSTPNLEWVLRTHYPHEEAGGDERVSGALRMNRAFHGWGHQFLYSEEMLAYVLEEMGFERISFFPYGESDTPTLKNIERHGKFAVHEGYPNVVIAEARKGERSIGPSRELSSRIKRNYLNVVHPGAH